MAIEFEILCYRPLKIGLIVFSLVYNSYRKDHQGKGIKTDALPFGLYATNLLQSTRVLVYFISTLAPPSLPQVRKSLLGHKIV